MAMYRIQAGWQNWPGAPGVSTFFQDPAVGQPNPEAIRVFFDALKGYLPTGLQIQVQGSGDMIEESSGAIAGSWDVATTPSAVVGTATGPYAGNAGAVVHWLTNTVAGGRRVRGRTFLVPLVPAVAFDSSGSLATALQGALRVAAEAMRTTTPGHFVVWHRPGVGAGSKAAIIDTRIPDLSVSLRSRRV